MGKFANVLKKRARRLAREKGHNRENMFIPEMIRKEIALAIEQMDRLKELHKKQLYRLLQVECYVDTEIMQMEQRMPRYSSYRFPEREKLQRRLFALGQERRKLHIQHEEKTRSLEDRLLSLINKHEQLAI
jgi:DNA integrity scanning protein DisA with diadenylate cyclase activity